MKRFKTYAVASVIAVLVIASTTSTHMQTQTPPTKFVKSQRPIPNRYIVVLNDDVVSSDASLEVRRARVTEIANSHAQAHGGKVHNIYETALKGYAIELPYEAAAIAISNLAEVRWVEEEGMLQPGGGMATTDKQMSLTKPDGLKWVQIRPGNEMAVVYGDPNKAGELYAVRFRFADGFKVPAHWHPQDEHATVLQGTLLLGMGTKWDAAQLSTEMKTGSYIFLPKEMPHFALAKGETILQAHGN